MPLSTPVFNALLNCASFLYPSMIAFLHFDNEMVENWADAEGPGGSDSSGMTTGSSGSCGAVFLVGIKTIGTNFRDFGAEFWISDELLELLTPSGNFFRERSCIAAMCVSNSSRYGRS